MENTGPTPRTHTPTSSNPVDRITVYKELYEKFSASATELGITLTAEQMDEAVNKGVELRVAYKAYIDSQRRAGLVDCPKCKARRRNPNFDLCAACAREAQKVPQGKKIEKPKRYGVRTTPASKAA